METLNFVDACCVGDMQRVLNGWLDDESLYHGYRAACMDGQWEVVRYLLNVPNVSLDVDNGFRWACSSGHLEVVKNLLLSDDIPVNADIHTEDEDGLRWAFIHRRWDVMFFLLTAPELTDHARLSCLGPISTCIGLLGREFIVKVLANMPYENVMDLFLNDATFMDALSESEREYVLCRGYTHDECEIYI